MPSPTRHINAQYLGVVNEEQVHDENLHECSRHLIAVLLVVQKVLNTQERSHSRLYCRQALSPRLEISTARHNRMQLTQDPHDTHADLPATGLRKRDRQRRHRCPLLQRLNEVLPGWEWVLAAKAARIQVRGIEELLVARSHQRELVVRFPVARRDRTGSLVELHRVRPRVCARRWVQLPSEVLLLVPLDISERDQRVLQRELDSLARLCRCIRVLALDLESGHKLQIGARALVQHRARGWVFQALDTLKVAVPVLPQPPIHVLRPPRVTGRSH